MYKIAYFAALIAVTTLSGNSPPAYLMENTLAKGYPSPSSRVTALKNQLKGKKI